MHMIKGTSKTSNTNAAAYAFSETWSTPSLRLPASNLCSYTIPQAAVRNDRPQRNICHRRAYKRSRLLVIPRERVCLNALSLACSRSRLQGSQKQANALLCLYFLLDSI